MRFSRLFATLFFLAASAYASDVRDLLNADTKEKRATFQYRQHMNFLVVSGPRDGLVTLRAFKGTRDSIIQQARAWAPNCSHMRNLVFGGWWSSKYQIKFNAKFDDWALPPGIDDGKWVFVFDVQPASATRARAGFLGVQDLDLDQDMVEAYFNTGLEVTVTNTRPTTSSPPPVVSSSVVVDLSSLQLVPGGVNAQHGTNVVPTTVRTAQDCSPKPRVLGETTLVATAPTRGQSQPLVARRVGEPASPQKVATSKR